VKQCFETTFRLSRMPRAKQRTPALRDAVLSHAMGHLEREGVAGFTTRSVARASATSTSAVYELFGDKGGLLREVYFEGFRLLRQHLGTLAENGQPVAELRQMVQIYRHFMGENPVLSAVMFSRPFTDFDPSSSERTASGSVREFIVERVRRCVTGGFLRGDETDVAHVLVALVQGLASAERARRLGTTENSINRRWDLAIDAVIGGLSPAPIDDRVHR
jgi:AcrR family transcriptional regulator